MANLAVGQRFKYQFFDGKAFHTPKDLNYDERREKIGEEISDAIVYMNSLKPQGILDSAFIKRMVTSVNSSLKREAILYESVGLSYPKMVNKNNILDTQDKINLLSQKLTQYFVGRSPGAFAFLSLLNDANFLSYISMKTVTAFSYTTFGEGDRNLGKTKATDSLSKAMRMGMKRIDASSQLRELVREDVLTLLNEGLEKGSPDFINEIDDEIEYQIQKLIEQTIKEHFEEQHVLTLKNSERAAKFRSKTGETEVKRFYKDLYRKFEQWFSRNLKNKKDPTGRYLGGALVIGEKITETKYGAQILAKIYEKDPSARNGYGELRKDLDFDTFAAYFADFLIAEIGKYQGTDSDAYKFILKERKKLVSVIKKAYSIKGATTEEKIRNFSQFSKSNISGLFGEIGAAFAFSVKGNEALITGDQKNKLGQKIATDVRLKVYKKEGRKIIEKNIVGIQVKNYTSTDSFRLYDSTQLNFDGKTVERYITPKDLRVLRFLAVNHDIASEKYGYDYSVKDLENFLYCHFENFIRIDDLKEDPSKEVTQNSFYYINNKVYPASYFLLVFLKEALDIFENGKKKSVFEMIGSFQNYPTVPNEPNGNFFEKIRVNEQPKAHKISVNSDGRMIYTSAWAFKMPDGNTYPKRIDDNLLSGLTIKFKGILVNTKKNW